MSWRQATDFERGLLENARQQWPAAVQLAQLLCLAPRIEPLLLRNMRRRWLPAAPAEVEAQLWFSPLVAARSSREITLHLGIARLLAEQLMADQPTHQTDRQAPPAPQAPAIAPSRLDQLWAFTRHHSRHWSAADRLERDLRYHALRDNDDAVRDGLKAILTRIQQETSPAQHMALARLAKRSLAVIAPPQAAGAGAVTGEMHEMQLLAQYAALALGDSGRWVQPGPPQALPAALAARLPPPLPVAELRCELRQDADNGQVLLLLDSQPGDPGISFPSPLPARLHVAADGQAGAWHSVTIGSRIAITPAAVGLRLTTLDGRQWDLRSEQAPPDQDINAKSAQPAQPAQPAPPAPPALLLIHTEADRKPAGDIAKALLAEGISVELLLESGEPGAPRPEVQQPGSDTARRIRLWSHAASTFWAGRDGTRQAMPADALLLRIDDSAPPTSGKQAGPLLDWPGSSQPTEAEQLLARLKQWWQHGELPGSNAPPAPTPAPNPQQQELDELLAEIDAPATEPPRRLAIGDRLAELGDPRPGVGTKEIDLPLEDNGTTPGPAPYPTAIQSLIDQLDDPNTEPPRRLEIGDELDRLDDPRPGVGLGADGLPDIAWLEVPAGPFVYQQSETRELPSFWLSRYPVTNRQYQAFIDAGGYDEGRWWQGIQWLKPGKSKWPQANRPRTNVSWFEAVAFCRWLNSRLGLADAIRLPSEWEWEKAARGSDGRRYPWGDKFRSGCANLDETWGKKGRWNLQQTTAVGVYPQGQSPYGVDDLSGNVREWCLNQYGQPDVITVNKDTASRVLRGGSWIHSPDNGRADNRFRNQAVYRSSIIGFRLLCSVPISPDR